MTADRRTERRSTRTCNASPYTKSKPQAQTNKFTSWSLAGLLNFLNPLRSRNSGEPESDLKQTSNIEADKPEQQKSQSNPRENSLPETVPPQPQVPPPEPQLPSSFSPHNSPVKNVDTVKNYLAQHGTRQLNPIEIAGLVSLLQDSIDGADEESFEPFRFSRSPSRGQSPISPIFSPSPTALLSTESNQTPTKQLTRNPNGSYRWQGGGSARTRNRYHSPAFGSPRSAPKMKITPSDPPKTDSKRRRVEPDAETSSPQKVSAMQPPAVPSSSQPTAGPSSLPNGTVKTNGHAFSSASVSTSTGTNGGYATPRVLKPSTPAVPSPLRQAWGQDDSPSPPHSKQTRAASFMTELIREATPAKKPDLSNPYQTASPVKSATLPTKKIPKKRVRSVQKPLVEEKLEPSPQAIIEATVPKGTKRSRPPSSCTPETNSVTIPSATPSPPYRHSPLPNGSAHPPINGTHSYTADVTEEEAEDKGPSPKKQKTSATAPSVVEIQDVEMAFTPPLAPKLRPFGVVEPMEESSSVESQTNGVNPLIPPSTSRPFLGVKSSVPKEPSKLRYSIKADEKEEHASSGKRDGKADAASSKEIVSFIFAIPAREPTGRSMTAEKAAKDLPVSELPTHDDWAFTVKVKANTVPTSTPPALYGGFDSAAAGMKAPEKPPTGL